MDETAMEAVAHTANTADGDIVMNDVSAAPVADTEKKEVKLDELFDDIDSDEEFPGSRPQDTPSSSSQGASPAPYAVSVVLQPRGSSNRIAVRPGHSQLLIRRS
jgi:hypothetical protein